MKLSISVAVEGAKSLAVLGGEKLFENFTKKAPGESVASVLSKTASQTVKQESAKVQKAISKRIQKELIAPLKKTGSKAKQKLTADVVKQTISHPAVQKLIKEAQKKPPKTKTQQQRVANKLSNLIAGSGVKKTRRKMVGSGMKYL